MRYNFKCPYCGKEVCTNRGDSAWARSRRLMSRQTLSYAHLSCIEAAMPKNKKEVSNSEG